MVGVGGMGGAIQFCNSGILQLLLLLMMAVHDDSDDDDDDLYVSNKSRALKISAQSRGA